MNLKDAAGRVRASLTVAAATPPAAGEEPAFDLLDSAMRPRVSLRANDAEGGVRVGAGAGPGFCGLRWTDGPHLDLVGADGKPLFHAP